MTYETYEPSKPAKTKKTYASVNGTIIAHANIKMSNIGQFKKPFIGKLMLDAKDLIWRIDWKWDKMI